MYSVPRLTSHLFHLPTSINHPSPASLHTAYLDFRAFFRYTRYRFNWVSSKEICKKLVETHQFCFDFKNPRLNYQKGRTVTTSWLQALIPPTVILFVAPTTTSRYLPFDAVQDLTSFRKADFLEKNPLLCSSPVGRVSVDLSVSMDRGRSDNYGKSKCFQD